MATQNPRLKVLGIKDVLDLAAAAQAIVDAQAAEGYSLSGTTLHAPVAQNGDYHPVLALQFHYNGDTAAQPLFKLAGLANLTSVDDALADLIGTWSDSTVGRELISYDVLTIQSMDAGPAYLIVMAFGLGAVGEAARKQTLGEGAIAGAIGVTTGTTVSTFTGATGGDAYRVNLDFSAAVAYLGDTSVTTTTLAALDGADTDILLGDGAVIAVRSSVTLEAVLYTARDYGVAGDDIAIVKLESNDVDSDLSIEVVAGVAGPEITITLEKVAGAITTTAADIVAALTDNTDPAFNIDAFALIDASTASGGTAQTAVAATALAGGADAVASDDTTAFLVVGDEVHVAVCLVTVLGVAQLFYVFGKPEATVSTLAARPTDRECAEALDAILADWDGTALVLDYLFIVQGTDPVATSATGLTTDGDVLRRQRNVLVAR